MILWESLGAGEKEECLKVLQTEANWAIWCKANPKDKGEQAFREHSRCIFTGKCKEPEGDGEKQEGASRGRHVTRARSRWKRADMSACAAHSNMGCWLHYDTILDEDQANQRLNSFLFLKEQIKGIIIIRSMGKTTAKMS